MWKIQGMWKLKKSKVNRNGKPDNYNKLACITGDRICFYPSMEADYTNLVYIERFNLGILEFKQAIVDSPNLVRFGESERYLESVLVNQ